MAPVLDRLLAPVGRILTPEVARSLVQVRATHDVQERVDYLAERANEGQLTPEEPAEYDRYIQGLHVIAILQAQAQSVLGAGSPS
jgi:hypothetical protein